MPGGARCDEPRAVVWKERKQVCGKKQLPTNFALS